MSQVNARETTDKLMCLIGGGRTVGITGLEIDWLYNHLVPFLDRALEGLDKPKPKIGRPKNA